MDGGLDMGAAFRAPRGYARDRSAGLGVVVGALVARELDAEDVLAARS